MYIQPEQKNPYLNLCHLNAQRETQKLIIDIVMVSE